MTLMRADNALLTEDARSMPLEHHRVAAADVVGGVPTTGTGPLLASRGVELGVWEITSGIVTDIEAEEIFVVLAGRGRVEFDDGSSLLLESGSIVHLRAGDRTIWTIYETLRKVYIMLPHQATEEEES
jgi:uncharacterized cupin superfamily protein